MNENINLRELLKGHEGEEFYTPLCGKVKLINIHPYSKFPISTDKVNFMANGKYEDDGECVIFPSKDQQDWNKWAEEQNKTIKLADIKEKVDKWYNSKTPEEVYRILKEAGAIEEVEEQKQKVPKTWDELVNADLSKDIVIHAGLTNAPKDKREYVEVLSFDLPIEKAALALLKIRQLIEVSYGGNVTDEEWNDTKIEKYVIKCNGGEITDDISLTYKYHVAFHTYAQKREFLSHLENVQLVKDFYMICKQEL